MEQSGRSGAIADVPSPFDYENPTSCYSNTVSSRLNMQSWDAFSALNERVTWAVAAGVQSWYRNMSLGNAKPRAKFRVAAEVGNDRRR